VGRPGRHDGDDDDDDDGDDDDDDEGEEYEEEERNEYGGEFVLRPHKYQLSYLRPQDLRNLLSSARPALKSEPPAKAATAGKRFAVSLSPFLRI
jgi:hypothetical protein